MNPLNCWEFMECGREPGGTNVGQLGVCPAAVETGLDGVNRGRCAGRACWAIAGTFGGTKAEGTYAQKLSTCVSCEFYRKVLAEEGDRYQGSAKILKKLNELKKG